MSKISHFPLHISIPVGALPKRRISTRRQGKRRASKKKLNLPNLAKCPHCGQPKLPHVVCPNCGKYYLSSS